MVPTQANLGSSPGTIDPGTVIETAEVLDASDASKMQAYFALGKNCPAGSVNGRDDFGVAIGETARILVVLSL